MKKFKRVLAAVLAATMVIGMMAVSAFAADGDWYVTGSSDGDNGGDWNAPGPFSECWNPAGDAMTDNGDGTYSITFKDVEAGAYAMKVTDGTWDNQAGGLDNGQEQENFLFTVDAKGDIKITFTPETKAITVAPVAEETAPPTGDASRAGLFVIIMAAAAAVVVISRKRTVEE